MADPRFPRGSANPREGCANLLFGRAKMLANDCMKMREFGSRDGALVPSFPNLDPPLLVGTKDVKYIDIYQDFSSYNSLCFSSLVSLILDAQ